MLLAWLLGCAPTPAPGSTPPEPTAPAETSILLVAWTAPEGWTWTNPPNAGIVGFGHQSQPGYAGSIRLEPSAASLDALRAEASRSSRNTVSDAVVGGRPALRIHYDAAFAKDSWAAWYVPNDRGELVRFDFQDWVPSAEVDALLASVTFVPPPRVATDARFVVSGTVGEYVGNCMPPSPCPLRPLATEIRFRAIGPGAAGGLAATARSDAQGRYRVELPPGTYSVLPVSGGAEVCKSTGPLGPCAIRVVDGPLTHDPVVDNAVW